MLAVLERRLRARPEPAAAPSTSRIPVGERLLGFWAIGLLMLFSTSVYAVFWAPKALLVMAMIVPGAVALVDAARRRVPGARWALAFVVAAGVSALLADRVWLAVLGAYNWGTGWLFIVAIGGCWAIGTRVSEPGSQWIERAVLGAAVASGVVAAIQSALTLPWEVLDPGGRASAFLGNPVHLGALAAGGVWIAAHRIQRRLTLWGLSAVAVLAGAVQLSGSRSALVPLVLAMAVWTRRLGARRGAAFVFAVAVGLAGAWGLGRMAGQDGVAATGRAAVSLSPGSSSGRTAAWRAAPQAVFDRPLFGWGPGRFQSGVSPHVGPQVARYEMNGAEYRDGHNLVVEYAVTTGLVGLALLGLWLGSAARHARGALAGFAGMVALVGLTQPQWVAVTPVAALGLGVAARAPSPPLGRWLHTGAGLGVLVAAVAAGVLVTGEVALLGAAEDFSPREIRTAARRLPPWPEVTTIGWRVSAFDAISRQDDAAWDEALAFAREATGRDPAISTSWANLGDLSLRRGDAVGAERAYRAAVERYPWSLRGLRGLVYFADERGDTDAVADLCERLEVVQPDGECLADVRNIYGDGESEHVSLLP